MKTLETERLILRKFTKNDFAAILNYTSCVENSVYMQLGRGEGAEEEARWYVDLAIAEAEKNPIVHYHFAAVLKENNQVIGGCRVSRERTLFWFLHRDYWGQGYGTEMGKALVQFGFDELNLHRIVAHCDVENISSYRVMEKIGMRREGLFIESRPAHKQSDKKYSDELSYAILKEEWETHNEIAYYNALPFEFNGFIDLPELSDDKIYLVCSAKNPANPEKKRIQEYKFIVCKDGEKIGDIGLRVGYTDGLYYGGQIGYNIDEKYRGNGYAGRACRLLLPVAKAHKMSKLLITNNKTNTASMRVCEKLGARLIRVARLPEWHDLYKEGQRFSNIYEWSVD